MATTYYVKNGGSDGANGLSHATAWEHISKADDLSGDQSDNKVLFHCGDTWNEQWVLACYGTEDHPFTIGAYYYDTIEHEGVSGNKPIIDGQNTRDTCIRGDTKHYVALKNLTLVNAHCGGSYCECIGVYDSNGWLIDNCDINHPTSRGIKFYGTSTSTIQNCHIYYDHVDNSIQADNVYIQGGGGNSVLHNYMSHPKEGLYVDGIQTYQTNGITIKYNFLENRGYASDDGSMLIQLEASSGTCIVAYNILYNDTDNFEAFIIVGPDSGATYYIYNNTIVNLAGTGDSSPAFCLCVESGASNDDFWVKNNIFYTSNSYPCSFASGVNSTSQVDYNCHYRVTGTNIVKLSGNGKTWAQWTTLGYDGNGFNTDPKFVNAGGDEAGDYKLDIVNTPLLNEGVSVSLTEDYFGTTVPKGSAPEIGFWEYPPTAKMVHPDVLDAALNYIKNNATRIAVCSTQPTTYTELITDYKLAIKTITSGDFTGPSYGDTSGRKLRSNQHSAISVDSSGTAQHIGFGDSVGSKLLFVTTCTDQVLTSGNTVTIPAWDMEISNPS